MPHDTETGEAFSSDLDALSAALPPDVDAEAVLSKLKDSGYTLSSSGSDDGLEAEEETAPASEEIALSGDGLELEPSGEAIEDEETLDISMGMMGADEPMAKRRDKVAEDLMDKYKTSMV